MQKANFKYQNFEGKIAVAVSGGVDSMCLLDFLSRFPNRSYELLAVNVEHGIRGESSLRDSEFVKDYCNEKGIKLISERVNSLEYAVENKISVEMAARELRYKVFEKVLSEREADLIALAHHADDQVETVLMRIFRGTGIDGLAGIKTREPFIRPFLSVSRADIEAYAKRNDIPFVQDETNLESAYTRNFVRNELIPMIKSKWENFDKSLLRLSKTAEEYTAYFDKISPKPNCEGGVVKLDIKELADCDVAIKKHAIRRAVGMLTDGVDFEETNLNDIINLMTKNNGACVHLANGVRAFKEYDDLVFVKSRENINIDLPFKEGEFEFSGKVWEIVPRTTERVRFDITKIPKGSVIRGRADGDTFKRFGGITSSLGDFYTNKKIPKRLRDEYPIIAFGKNVLVTPWEIADEVKSDGQNEYTLRIKED